MNYSIFQGRLQVKNDILPNIFTVGRVALRAGGKCDIIKASQPKENI